MVVDIDENSINITKSATKKIVFDSARCIGTLLAYSEEETPQELLDAICSVELPDSLDIVCLTSESYTGDISDLIDIIDEDYENNMNTYLLLTDISLFTRDLVDILKVRRDGTVRLFIMIPELNIDAKTSKVKGYGLRDLNNPFIIQNTVYIDDDSNRIYNTENYYRNLNKRKVV